MLDNEQSNPDDERKEAQRDNRRAYMRQYQKELRTKRKRLELSLEPEEYSRLKREANRHKMKVATFAREAIFAHLDGEYILPNPDQVQELELALRQIGNDVHQIARRVGREQATGRADINALERLVHDLEDQITLALRNPEKQ